MPIVNNTRISVIITVYNRDYTLDKCIKSILDQKDVSIELLLIDDGSTDNSLEICKAYESAYDNVKVFHQENGGLSKARNTGLNNCTGDYICFLDDDDVMTPGSLKVMLDAMLSNDVDMVVGNFERVDEDGNIVRLSYMPEYVKNKVISVKDYWEASFDPKGYFIFIVNWAKLYKRKIFEPLRFPEDYRKAQDEYVLVDTLDSCKNIYVTDYIVYKQTNTKNSITRSKFGINTLRAPETKLITTSKLIARNEFKFAVKKWGIACGEIVTYTRKATDPKIRQELKRLYTISCKQGHILFKYFDFQKKIKFLLYRIVLPVLCTLAIDK